MASKRVAGEVSRLCREDEKENNSISSENQHLQEPLEGQQLHRKGRIHLTKQGESMFANRLANLVRRALS